MQNKKLTICFFGRYDNKYSRNRILIKGLLENDVNVIECRTELKGVIKYFDLIKKHWKIRKEYDVLFVAFPGWHSVVLAKFLTRKPVIFDAFVSIYDSTVFDRKNTKEDSLKAKYFWFIDWISCKLADKVILDTNEHIKYFVQEFGIKKEKFERIFVGSFAETFSFPKIERKNNKFIVSFYGFLIPLQGVRYIIDTAKLLEKYDDIQFNLIGTKIKKRYQNEVFSNINFIEDRSYKDLLGLLKQSSVCLGIFGDTDKTQRVIPNKVFDCVALKKPVITADTLAIKELFDEDDLYLIPPVNSKRLAKAILELRNDYDLMEKIAQNGYNRFNQNTKIQSLGERLKEISLTLL
ncbi:MAG: glycosyltransferase [Candidatus Pacebacteria bacterium]|nr:glycosyltransferase [Candidatus Paceibacterota bacterium]